MNKMSGIILSEVVTYILIVVVLIAVAIGIYTNTEIDKKYESAEAVLTSIKERTAAIEAAGDMIACDNSILDEGLLSNDLVTFSVVPAEATRFDPSKGYGIGVQMVSKAKADAKDSFTITSRLYKSLREENKSLLRNVEEDEEKISFTLLVSDGPICAPTDTQMASDAPAANGSDSEQSTEMVMDATTSS